MVMDKYPDGRMEEEDFIKMFFIAFPARPEEKVHELAKRIANKDGKICKWWTNPNSTPTSTKTKFSWV